MLKRILFVIMIVLISNVPAWSDNFSKGPTIQKLQQDLRLKLKQRDPKIVERIQQVKKGDTLVVPFKGGNKDLRQTAYEMLIKNLSNLQIPKLIDSLKVNKNFISGFNSPHINREGMMDAFDDRAKRALSQKFPAEAILAGNIYMLSEDKIGLAIYWAEMKGSWFQMICGAETVINNKDVASSLKTSVDSCAVQIAKFLTEPIQPPGN